MKNFPEIQQDAVLFFPPPDHLREGERPGLGGLGTRPDQGQRPGGEGSLVNTNCRLRTFMVIGDLLKQSTKSCISKLAQDFLSVKTYEGIPNLENPRGGNLSGPPCMQLSHTCDWQCCTLATVTVAHMQLKLLHLVTATVTLLWLPLSPSHLESAAVVYKHLQCNIHAPETVASMLLHLLHNCEQMYDELSSSLQCTL